MELELEIAAPTLAAIHPELYHYTDLNGLVGILRSDTIWATHFSHLNDATEVMLLQRPLAKALGIRALSHIKSTPYLNRPTRRRLEKAGGATRIITDAAHDFIDALFKTAFKQEGTEPLAEPYIASFCAHSGQQSYEIEHGLLSQWRAYGGVDRYCIVFDTSKMTDLLAKEFDTHYWIYMRLAEVYYATEGATLDKLFPELLRSCEDELFKALNGSPVQISRETLINFFSAAPRLKHQGFKEEQEVRIVAIPGTQRTLDKILIEHPAEKFSPLKSIQQRTNGTGKCPYIALFDSLSTKLPIKRIIVGPSRHQEESLAKARQLTGTILQLTCSETPFIG